MGHWTGAGDKRDNEGTAYGYLTVEQEAPNIFTMAVQDLFDDYRNDQIPQDLGSCGRP